MVGRRWFGRNAANSGHPNDHPNGSFARNTLSGSFLDLHLGLGNGAQLTRRSERRECFAISLSLNFRGTFQ